MDWINVKGNKGDSTKPTERDNMDRTNVNDENEAKNGGKNTEKETEMNNNNPTNDRAANEYCKPTEKKEQEPVSLTTSERRRLKKSKPPSQQPRQKFYHLKFSKKEVCLSQWKE